MRIDIYHHFPHGCDDRVYDLLKDVHKVVKEIKMTEQEALAILKDIDTTTSGIGDNLQVIADAQTEEVGVVTEIGTDIDSLLALVGQTGNVPSTVADALNALKAKAADSAARSATIAQATKDQVPVLKALAAKNDVPVPPPPPPPPLP